MRGAFFTIFFLTGFFLTGLAHNAWADANPLDACPYDAFHITGIEVEAVAENGSAARTRATAEGLTQAWQALLNRLLVEGDGDALSKNTVVAQPLPQALLDHTRLRHETVLPNRYRAGFDYCFDRKRVRQFFAEHNLAHAELFSPPMLVLPILIEANQPRLWREPNPWLAAWRAVLRQHDGLVTLRLPQQLATERGIDPESLLAGSRPSIARAAALESADRVIITTLTPHSTDGAMTISAQARLYSRDGRLESEFYTIDGRIMAQDSLALLADEIAKEIEQVWRSVNVVTAEDGGQLMLVIPAKTRGLWLSYLQTLRQLPMVEQVTPVQIDSQGGVVVVHLSASWDSFTYAIEQAGFGIKAEAGRLTLTGQ